MAKIKKTAWDQLMSYVNLGSQMAAGHDAAFVLVAVAEVVGNSSPVGVWVTSGVTNELSIARSEATIAMLEMAAKELRGHHKARFGQEPESRGYKGK